MTNNAWAVCNCFAYRLFVLIFMDIVKIMLDKVTYLC